MTGLATLLCCVAALVLVGQWVSLRALAIDGPVALPPHLHARVQWWAAHRVAVRICCVALIVVAVATGLLID